MDSALARISEIIQLEDVPSIQMEVAVLVREFPDIRYSVSAPANGVMNASANATVLLLMVFFYAAAKNDMNDVAEEGITADSSALNPNPFYK